jgi:hypothetical protein
MWTYPGWPLWADLPPASKRPSAAELIMSKVRHPSFTPEVAERLVSELPRRQLRQLWKETGRVLEGDLADEERFHVVVLRERLLDRL